MACSLIGYAFPVPTAISNKYQLHEFSITLHNGSNQKPLKINMNHGKTTHYESQPGNNRILAHCLKEHGFKIYHFKSPSKEVTFQMH
jgi:hypothetical protein